MLPIVKAQISRSSLDRASKLDPLSRLVQLGLVLYLSPVILLVAIIGGVSLAAQIAGRLVLKPGVDPLARPVRIVFHPRDGKTPVEGNPRNAHVAH